MILYNQAANVTDLETDNHFLPGHPHPVRRRRTQLLAFLGGHPGVTATLTAGVKRRRRRAT